MQMGATCSSRKVAGRRGRQGVTFLLEERTKRGTVRVTFMKNFFTSMLGTLVATLAPATRLCVAVDLTLPTEAVITRPVRSWRGRDFSAYAKRPAIFLIEA